ncbi:phosphotransferase [Streptosporangium soli]|nr:phosphotransferase [Streptosporangium sp. KLBMP 9127]
MAKQLPESVALGELSSDLPIILEAFGLGNVHEMRYLTEGLMNRNWKVITEHGTFVLKRIIDVPLPLARRNLSVLTALANDGVPACPPVTTTSGEPVVKVEERGYCLCPWVEGDHPRGYDLTLAQVGILGAMLGRIHRSLNRPQTDLPDKPASVRAPVPNPITALEEADRFMKTVSSLDAPTAFDAQVTNYLERREVLLEKYSHLQPKGDEPRGPFGWTHGDFQHLNVIWREEAIAGVVDWDRIRVRPFGEEVARSATLLFGSDEGDLDLDRVSAFVNGYRSVIPLSREDLEDAVHRLWWKRMCDYWQLEFHYDRGDHSCDHLFLSSSRCLEWWTSRRDEVKAAFTAG